MSSFNRQSRELKLKFSEKKDDIQHKLDSRQVFLTVEIEKLRNERSYWTKYEYENGVAPSLDAIPEG